MHFGDSDDGEKNIPGTSLLQPSVGRDQC